tara:strand:- start:876 stop:1073 length:198 start_codon:yes stop_codon:yes gene_type:complete
MIFGKFKKGAGELNQKVYPASKKCEGAGVVKRAGLKIQWLSACAGSNPVPRIMPNGKRICILTLF